MNSPDQIRFIPAPPSFSGHVTLFATAAVVRTYWFRSCSKFGIGNRTPKTCLSVEFEMNRRYTVSWM